MDTRLTIEEMVNKSYRGISCKICEEKGFGRLFRTAHGTQKSNYGCHKCIIALLESMIGNDSDENKIIQDAINYIKI